MAYLIKLNLIKSTNGAYIMDVMNEISLGQYNLIYNAFSFGFATMMAATLYLWIQRSQVSDTYKAAVTISGLVTFIAAYHYLQIFLSWEAAFSVNNGAITTTGKEYNLAYRYVDWLLTVPLLLIELILVMNLSKAETVKKSWTLGVAAALMIVLGYPGEIAGVTEDVHGTRWLWWALSMIPFLYIVSQLFFGLKESIDRQPEDVKGLVSTARYVVVFSWCFYPVVFIFPMIGLTGATAVTAVEVGYTVADIVAKAVFGVMIYTIAVRKSQAEKGIL